MLKKSFSILLLLLCAAALAFLAERLPDRKTFSQLCVDKNEWDQLITERQAYVPEEDGAPLFNALYMGGNKLAFDQPGSMFLYSLIEGHPQAYDPPVQIDSHQNGAKIAFCGEAITDELISGNRSVDMMIYTQDRYALYQLKCTTLPVIEIDIPPSSITREHAAAHLRLFDNRKGASNRIIHSDSSIHLRGNSSTIYPKKDYRISLRSRYSGNDQRNNHVSLLGMRSDDDWILKAMYNDKDKIREVFSTNLWYQSCAANNSFSFVNGTQYRYVELFIGQTYCGLYGLCHPLDAKQFDLKEGEHLYKKAEGLSEFTIDFTAPNTVSAYEYLGYDKDQPDYEPLQAYYKGLFSTQDPEKAELHFQKYYLNLDQYIGRDPQITHDILYHSADLRNAIDIYLFINLIQGVDQVQESDNYALNNLYMAAKRTPDGNLQFLYTPWDMDRTWGLSFGDSYKMDPERTVTMVLNPIHILLEQGDQEAARMLVNRYRELRSGAWSDETIDRMLLEHEADVCHSGAYARDYDRWSHDYARDYEAWCGEARPNSDNTLTEFYYHVLDRLWYMDDQIENLAYEFNV